jgi:hypothetical protein
MRALSVLDCRTNKGMTLFGLMSSNIRPVARTPRIDERRAHVVLSKVDQILAREATQQRERDTMYVELGQYLCEIRAGQYWRIEGLASFDEFIAKRFPGSRRKAYYFMAIHEQLPKETKVHLRGIGWSKAIELNRVARSDRERFDSATWLHKARTMKKEEFKQEVEQHIYGSAAEPFELLYFKVNKGQLSVIEQALETAAMLLGSDRSRGYCLEMVCADFLAGANCSSEGDSNLLVTTLARTFALLDADKQDRLLESLGAQRSIHG